MGAWGIALVPAVVSLAAFVFSILLWQRSKKMAGQIRSAREAPQTDLDEILSLLKFEDVPPATHAMRRGQVVSKNRGVENKSPNRLVEKVALVQSALQSLRSNAGRHASQIPDGAELRILSQQIRSGASHQQLQAAERKLQDLAGKVLKIALSSSDRDIDPERENAEVQRALMDLCEVARCHFIDPKEGDEFSTADHRSSATIRPPSIGLRAKVAKVAARGLRTEEGRLIAEAEVSVYD